MTIKLKDSDFEKLPKCKCGSGLKCIYYCLRSKQCNPDNLGFYCDVCSQTEGKHDHQNVYVKSLIEREEKIYADLLTYMKEIEQKAKTLVQLFTPMLTQMHKSHLLTAKNQKQVLADLKKQEKIRVDFENYFNEKIQSFIVNLKVPELLQQVDPRNQIMKEFNELIDLAHFDYDSFYTSHKEVIASPGFDKIDQSKFDAASKELFHTVKSRSQGEIIAAL